MAEEEEAKPAEENAEATEAAEATGDAAAEAPAEVAAPKQQSVWLPIMASSIISIAGAFVLFKFVIGPKMIKEVNAILGAATPGAPHAGSGGEGDKKGDPHKEEGDSHKGDDHGAEKKEGATTDPNVDDSKGPISIVGDEGEAIVINPANSGGMRYLLVDIYLIRASEKDLTFKGAIDSNSKKLQSLTMDKLSERDIQELSNPSVRKQIETDLKLQYQRVLGVKEHPIKEIVVTKWIMQ